MSRKIAITCLALATLIAGCGDNATAPVRSNAPDSDSAAMDKHGNGSRFSGYMVGAGDEGASHSLSAGGLSADAPKYKAVKTPHATAKVTTSAEIGAEGGVLRLPTAGLIVVVPPGAVSTKTHFSVTNQANMLGYTFEPHGTHFAVPLRVTQSLGLTEMLANLFTPFQVAYFSDDTAVDPTAGTVTARELLPVSIDRAVSGVTFEVSHFSGYMLVSARAQ